MITPLDSIAAIWVVLNLAFCVVVLGHVAYYSAPHFWHAIAVSRAAKHRRRQRHQRVRMVEREAIARIAANSQETI